MDPYATLGISQGADEEILKRAFRKEAMKWHPDRAGESAEAKEKFQQAALAYQILSRQIKNKTRAKQTPADPDPAKEQESDIDLDGILQDVLLDYAISLIRSGYSRKEVKGKMQQNGCNAKMAGVIAHQAFKFQQDFTSNTRDKNNSHQNGPKLIKRKFDYALIQAVLGKQNPGRKERKTISDYHETFNDLYAREQSGAIVSFSKNHYLSKVFNRAMMLFLIIAAMVYYLPQLTRHIPLALMDFFQLPYIILSLMIVWSFYRKLWLLSSIGIGILALTQLLYLHFMPIALEKEFSTIMLLSFACYFPFIFLAHLSNFFYYRKAKGIIELVELNYPKLDEKQILIRNRANVSPLAAVFGTLLLSLYFLQVIPATGSLDNKINQLFSANAKPESMDMKLNKARISEAKRMFDIAEKQFNRTPPEFNNAKKAYLKSAKYGSLLSSYKLGYMYLIGLGGEQNDHKAFQYFTQAVKAPLASQPHSLTVASKWLAESYNSLGILYLGGYGTTKNQHKAREMFRQAIKYGSANQLKNLRYGNTPNNVDLRKLATRPVFTGL